jgi:hypothetical protein
MRKRLKAKQQDVEFVCFDCDHKSKICPHNVDEFYNLTYSQKSEPPKFECDNCLGGICFPLNYTNKFGYSFESEQISPKNRIDPRKITETPRK